MHLTKWAIFSTIWRWRWYMSSCCSCCFLFLAHHITDLDDIYCVLLTHCKVIHNKFQLRIRSTLQCSIVAVPIDCLLLNTVAIVMWQLNTHNHQKQQKTQTTKPNNGNNGIAPLTTSNKIKEWVLPRTRTVLGTSHFGVTGALVCQRT